MADYIKAEIVRKRERILQIRAVRKANEYLQQIEKTTQDQTEENKNKEFADSSCQDELNSERLLEDLGLEITEEVMEVQKLPQLALSHVHQTSLSPREHITYNKYVQTTNPEIKIQGLISCDASKLDNSSRISDDFERMPQVELVKPVITAADKAAAVTKTTEAKNEIKLFEIGEEERQKVMSCENFVRFFERSSKLMEKALGEDWDAFFVDYGGTEDDEFSNGDQLRNGLTMSLNFYNEKWCRGRVVTSLSWSTHFPELLAASYGKNEDSWFEPDGMASIWNLKFKKTCPEYVFHCQSAVTSATFATFHPNLLIGGTYSGQIVIWDNRVAKRTPIQRNSSFSQGHTHPIHCIKVIGTQNDNSLVSISSDGKLCTWSLDMMSQPLESVQLSRKLVVPYISVSAKSFSFPIGDVNNFIVGSDECDVFSACRYGSQAGVNGVFKGHQGPVTAVDHHHAPGLNVDFSHLFLTSSFDWTVKLWSAKENRPLYSFEDFGDYVTDVGWSPIHLALFANVDGSGRLGVWNINSNIHAPASSAVVDDSPVLCKLAWAYSGYQLAVGDIFGKLWVYDVGEQLASPKANESTQLTDTLSELKNDRTDEIIRKLL